MPAGPDLITTVTDVQGFSNTVMTVLTVEANVSKEILSV